jgi:hypothetical protein
MFLLLLVLLQCSKIIVWCFWKKITHFYNETLMRICLCLHVHEYEIIKYILFSLFMAHIFVIFHIIVVYRAGVCQSHYGIQQVDFCRFFIM